MKFLGNIEVQLDEVACLAVFEMCQCPSMGEFTREGFTEGWKKVQSVITRTLPS
jgi:DCN1-like protein 1/2